MCTLPITWHYFVPMTTSSSQMVKPVPLSPTPPSIYHASPYNSGLVLLNLGYGGDQHPSLCIWSSRLRSKQAGAWATRSCGVLCARYLSISVHSLSLSLSLSLHASYSRRKKRFLVPLPHAARPPHRGHLRLSSVFPLPSLTLPCLSISSPMLSLVYVGTRSASVFCATSPTLATILRPRQQLRDGCQQ